MAGFLLALFQPLFKPFFKVFFKVFFNQTDAFCNVPAVFWQFFLKPQRLKMNIQ